MSTVEPDLIEGYTLEKVIGKGGMGIVVKGRQHSLDKDVAVKILSPKLAQNEEFVKRFLREAKVAGQLNHPNIMHVIDAGKAGEHYYLVMEFIDGETLADLIKSRGTLKEKEAFEIAKQVAAALADASAKGLVHRDIKPQNIMLTKDGAVKLCDLGLAKRAEGDAALTQDNTFVGTPYYVSPEQAKGQQVDTRSDIYSLGMTLYHALSGRPPFEGDSIKVLAMQIDPKKTPPSIRELNPEISLQAASVLKKMFAKKPADRFQTPDELIEAIDAVIEGKPIGKVIPRASEQAAQKSVSAPAVQPKKTALIAVAAAGGIALILILILAVSSGGGKEETSSPSSTVARESGNDNPRPRAAKPVPERDAGADSRASAAAEAANIRTKENAAIAALDSEITDLIAASKFSDAEQLLAVAKIEGKSESYKSKLEDIREKIRTAWSDFSMDRIKKVRELAAAGNPEKALEIAKESAPLIDKGSTAELEQATQIAQKALDEINAAAVKRDKIASFDSGAYASVLKSAMPQLLRGDYEAAFSAIASGVSKENKDMAQAHAESCKKVKTALEKKLDGLIGLPTGFHLISGYKIEDNFLGLKNGSLVFDHEGKPLPVPLCLFSSDEIFALIADEKITPFDRGVFCIHNLWFDRAKAELKAATGENIYAKIFLGFAENHKAAPAEAALPEIVKNLDALAGGREFLPAFAGICSLDALAEDCGAKPCAESAALKSRILSEQAKDASADASKSKEPAKLREAYAADMAKIAGECLEKGKTDLALAAVEKALAVCGEYPYALILKAGIERKRGEKK
jgi:serine/threonine protein kinase